MMSIASWCVLEQVRDNPGNISPCAASAAAGDALAEIERLRSALERIASRHHSEKLLWWHQEARDALDGAPSKMTEQEAGMTRPGGGSGCIEYDI